jgi:hypothetical protein
MPRPSHSSRFHHPHKRGWGVHIIKLVIMKFSSPPCYLVYLRPKYSPQQPILKHLQPTFFSQCQRPSFTPIQNNCSHAYDYKTYGDILILFCLNNWICLPTLTHEAKCETDQWLKALICICGTKHRLQSVLWLLTLLLAINDILNTPEYCRNILFKFCAAKEIFRFWNRAVCLKLCQLRYEYGRYRLIISVSVSFCLINFPSSAEERCS